MGIKRVTECKLIRRIEGNFTKIYDIMGRTTCDSFALFPHGYVLPITLFDWS